MIPLLQKIEEERLLKKCPQTDMITANARALFNQEGPFKVTEIKRRELQPHDVLIEIKSSGIFA